jgi:rhodanese-related sulfurtransferase
MRPFPPSHPLVGAAAVLTLALVPLACSSDDDGSVAQSGEAGGEAGGGTPSTDAGAAAELASPEEFAAVIADGSVPLLNVHIPYEREIEGTDLFIPFDDLGSYADQLPTDKGATFAIYCRSGNMSADAAVDLAAMGYTDVVDLDGGMVAWEEAGLELVDDPTNADS